MEFGLEDGEPLASLGRLAVLRGALDRAERDLIAAARQHGASWSEIGEALGLRSRQAAEQRWLRLSDPTHRDPATARSARMRQRRVDAQAGPSIAHLRAAALAAARRLEGEADWDGLDSRAALVRVSLTLAATAEPGALFSLAAQAIADLDAFAVRVPTPAVRAALDRLRLALDGARPH